MTRLREFLLDGVVVKDMANVVTAVCPATTTEERTIRMEQLVKDEMEERTTFVITSVVNPVDRSEVSLQQAIILGVIRPTEGVYFNSIMGTTVPIATAMSDGLIKVDFTTAKRYAEKKTSIGIITMKTTRDGMPPEVVQTMYAVRAVVDHRMKKTVTFPEAVQSNIVDKTAGTYRNNLTDEKMFVEDAIKRGFLKARIIDDESCMDVDPLNRMVIERTEKIRRQIVKPLGVIGAFKTAGRDGVKI